VSWLQLDDRILDHPKFIRAVNLGGSEAVHLWLGLRAYCGQLLTDGLIPSDMIGEVRGPKEPRRRAAALAALKAAGLVDPDPEGVRMHDYLQWSASRDDITSRRKSARERQTRHRDKSAPDERESRVTSALVTEPSPIRSDPTPIHTTPEPQKASVFWTGWQWRERFGRAWAERYQQLAYGGGDADAKASGDLRDQLSALPDLERKAAQDRAPAMFAEFLADESPGMIKARHPFSWFVTRFNGLRVPAQALGPAKTPGIDKYPLMTSGGRRA
jgi:hypothetical protein